MSFKRKFLRVQLRKQYGNKKLADVWRRLQIQKMGVVSYIELRLKKLPKDRENLYVRSL